MPIVRTFWRLPLLSTQSAGGGSMAGVESGTTLLTGATSGAFATVGLGPIVAGAKEVEAGKRLIAYLNSVRAAPTIKAGGMEPLFGKRGAH